MSERTASLEEALEDFDEHGDMTGIMQLDIIANAARRVSALEALLAECEDLLDVFARHSSGDSTVTVSTDAVRRARALLAKLKARTK